MAGAETVRAEAERLFEAGRLEEALQKYRSLLAECPEDGELLSDAATVCYALGQTEIGAEYYRKALRADPANPTLRENLEMLARSGMLPESLRNAFRQGADSNSGEKDARRPDSARCFYPLGAVPGRAHTRRARIFTDPRCNVRCRFCYYWQCHAEAWPARLIRRQIDFAAEAGMRDIDFSGGESSVRKDFIDLVAYARQYDFRSICTLTNGWMFADEDFMRRAVEAGLTEILFSVHGYSEENHDWLTQREGSYRRIMRAIELAHEHGLTVRTNTTVTRTNYDRLEEHARIIRDRIRPCQANFILFNEFAQAGKIADRFSVRYSEGARAVKGALDVLRGTVPYLNVRYIPFCFMKGYEKHVCDYTQKIYDPFEWSQRMLVLCQRQFIEKPLLYHRYLGSALERYAHCVEFAPGAVPGHVADDVFVVRNRHDYVMAQSCRECRYQFICDGVEQEYSCQIGLHELDPVPGDKITNPLHFRMDFYDGYHDYLADRACETSAAEDVLVPAVIGRATRSLSVVIPTYNRRDILSECLRALDAQELDADRFEVIVVDDGSDDGSLEAVAEMAPGYSLTCHRQHHAGPAAARNLGIRRAEGEVVLILNDDAIATPALLAGHLEAHERFGRNDRIVVLGGREFSSDCRDRVMNYLFEEVPLYSALQQEERGFKGYMGFITFNLSAERRGFYRYGFFDEEFETAIAEDSELGWRWTLNGAKILFEPDLTAYHRHPMTVDGWDSHIIRSYQNRAIMHRKQPGTKPRNYHMDADEAQMRAFVEKGRQQMQRFRAELETLQDVTVDRVGGRPFMGVTLEGPKRLVETVRELAPHYKVWRSFSHYLKHRAETMGAAG